MVRTQGIGTLYGIWPLGPWGRRRSRIAPRRISFQGPRSSPGTCGRDLRPWSGECCSVPVQYSTWYGAHPVLCHCRDFPLGTETDPGWKCSVILYILEDFSFNNFVLNVALLSHDLLISNEPAVWSINLHGNPYKSGGNALCVCILTFYSRNFLQT